MSCEDFIGRAVNSDFVDGVAFANRVDDVLTLGGFSKNGVFSVEMRSGAVRDKELGTIGIWSSIGHGEDPGLVVTTGRLALALKLVARATSA